MFLVSFPPLMCKYVPVIHEPIFLKDIFVPAAKLPHHSHYLTGARSNITSKARSTNYRKRVLLCGLSRWEYPILALYMRHKNYNCVSDRYRRTAAWYSTELARGNLCLRQSVVVLCFFLLTGK